MRASQDIPHSATMCFGDSSTPIQKCCAHTYWLFYRSAQFIKMFPRATVDPKRARNRAATMKQQIAYSKFDTEVTELGRMLFGLNDN